MQTPSPAPLSLDTTHTSSSLPSLSQPQSSRQQVWLPPATLADFVIHYRCTDFHTHALVLRHHSAYIRHYLHSQTAPTAVRTEEVEAEGGTKRRRVTAFTSSEECAKCGPYWLTHCIKLPDHCGGEPSSEYDFLLFHQHLYHSAVHHSPPFSPKRSIVDTLTGDAPISLVFPDGNCTGVHRCCPSSTTSTVRRRPRDARRFCVRIVTRLRPSSSAGRCCPSR